MPYGFPDKIRDRIKIASVDFRNPKSNFWWSEETRKELLSPDMRWDLPDEGDPEREETLLYKKVVGMVLERYFDDRHRVGYGLELWAELHVLPVHDLGI